jgi:glycosyltransferase involved in cell wall biosynthesis
MPAIGAADRVLLWGGGMWGWLDPLTPLRAVRRLAASGGPRVHLVFLGAARPALAQTGQAGAVERARAAAAALGLLGELVHVNPGWVPYAERGAWLAEADLAVTAHADHLEARFAHRTRVLDALWAGLPVVATAGDALAELVERRGLGAAVPPGDDGAFAAACRRLLGADGPAARACVAAIRAELTWERAAAPLVGWCAGARTQPRRPPRRASVRRALWAHYAAALPEQAAEEGAAAAAARVGRRLRRALTLPR